MSVVENGKVTYIPFAGPLNLILRTVATYSCNTGFDLVGQTTRVCEDTNGGTLTTGTWSGSAPTCNTLLVNYMVAVEDTEHKY